MTNIVHMATRTADFGGDELYFPVEERTDFMPGLNTDGHKAIVRTDTGRLLAVHSEKYQLVENRTVFLPFEDALRQSSLNLSGMNVQTELLDDGGAVVRAYTFPEHRIEVAPGDVVDLQLNVRNSYNGRYAFTTMLGGFRLICTNGMVIGDKMLNMYGKHTKNLDTEQTVGQLDRCLEVYMSHSDKWQEWARSYIDSDGVIAVLKKHKLPESFITTIVGQFAIESASLGKTLWAFYNALTWWSTHYQIRSGSQRAVVQENRERRVRQVITSDAFEGYSRAA